MYTMQHPHHATHRSRLGHLLGLAALVVGLVAGAVLLLATAGPPRLLEALPGPDGAAGFLRGSDVPWDALGYVLTTAAWALWLWLVVSLALRVAVAAAEALASGARWVRSLRAFSDRVTLPVVRRVVDGAFVAGTVVTLVGRASPVAAAELPTVPVVASLASTVPGAAHQQAAPAAAPEAAHSARSAGLHFHIVAPGDNLWDIARRRLGSGEEYPRIVEANVGHRMADGRTFTREGVIHPGWVLEIPIPSREIEDVDGLGVYVVRPGDTLEGIAARLLGSEERWRELFDLNQFAATMPDGRVLTNKDLIWPGLPLALPARPDGATADAGAPQLREADGVEVAGAATTGTATAYEPAAAPVQDAVNAPGIQSSVPSTADADADGAHASPTPSAEGLPPDGDAGAPGVPPAGVEEPPYSDGGAAERDHRLPAVLAGEPAEWVGPAGGAAHAQPATGGYPGWWRVPAGVAGAALAAAGAMALAQRERRSVRRSTDEPPIPDAEAHEPGAGALAAADPGRALASRRSGIEPDPAAVLADHVARVLARSGAPATPLWVVVRRDGRGIAADVYLRAAAAAQPSVVALAGEVGARLGCDARARQQGDDVLLVLSRLKPASLVVLGASLAPHAPGESRRVQAAAPVPLMVPAGTSGGGVLSLNWSELRHVLLVASSREPARGVLAHLVAALACREEVGELEFWIAEDGDALPAPLFRLPHVRRAPHAVRAADEPGAGAAPVQAPGVLLAEAYRELRRRMGEGAGARSARPRIVVVVPDLADTASDDAALDALEALGAHGVENGVLVLAGSSRADRLGETVLRQFHTRLVFQLPDEEPSVAVLGCPDAAGLGPATDMLVQVGNRTPLRARGLSIGSDELEAVVTAIRESTPSVAQSERLLRQHEGADGPLPPLGGASEPSPTGGVRDDRPAAAEPDVPGDAEQPTAGPLVNAATPALSTNGHVLPGETQESPRVGTAPPAAVRDAPPAVAQSSPGKAGAGYVVGPSERDPRQEAPADGAAPATVPASPANAASNGRETEALVDVRCFGELEIVAGGATLGEGGQAAAQSQSREVLAFLASQQASGVSRDRLMTALWPDTDTERGAKRLTVTLVRLRQMLTAQVPELPSSAVRCDRDGTCRLDTRLIRSDVHEFLALEKAARSAPPDEARQAYARAVALYRGDLLTHPDYVWLDERGDRGVTLREHYRELWRRMSLDLARLHIEAGDPAAAVPVYKSLLRVEPTLEDLVRALYRCYEALGDRKALILEDRRLRQALREALADPDDPGDDPAIYEPEAETVELFDTIMARFSSKDISRRDQEEARVTSAA